MKLRIFLAHSLILLLSQTFAQTPAYSPIEIKLNSDLIRWVQSVPPSIKTNSSLPSDNFNLLDRKPNTGLDFSKVPKGFLGIGHNATRNIYGFISEEVVVTLKPGEENMLAQANANCKLIVENARMYACKATSVPNLQSLLSQLKAMPSVKTAQPQFVTHFKKPM